MKLYIILGSTRQGRKSDIVANWIKSRADTNTALKAEGIEVELIDLRDWVLPFLDAAESPSSGKYPEGIIQDWGTKIDAADGFLIVTPEYNHGYSAVLKNAFDVIFKEWNGKPVAFVSYGWSASGARAIEQLRQVVAELKMFALRESVSLSIPQIIKSDGSIEVGDAVNKSADGMIAELGRWISIMKKARE